MINQILELLISSVIELYTMLVLLRLMMQLARADFYNPISQFIVKATDPLLKPLRRFIPGLWGIDIPSIVLALLVQIVGLVLMMLLKGTVSGSLMLFLLLGLFGVLNISLKIAFFAIIIVIVVSWIAPQSYNPAVSLLRQISDPLMAPFRRIIPPMGGLDFAPMLAMFVIHVLRSIVLPNIFMAIGG
ncbi:MAG: YggT family protein [Cellvibrionales bacterium]|jgi:YggT family protein|nr:YggT family protein [Cellvibrionales bacterium]